MFSLAKRVEAMQGRYGVQSRNDGMQGSLFWFEIPYRPDESIIEENIPLLLDIILPCDQPSYRHPLAVCLPTNVKEIVSSSPFAYNMNTSTTATIASVNVRRKIFAQRNLIVNSEHNEDEK